MASRKRRAAKAAPKAAGLPAKGMRQGLATYGDAPDLIEAVKRGVLLSGALPMVFPTISIHESFSHPTSMYLRNLMAIDTEEMIRAQPMDSVVLIGGCDKTLPAQTMAAASANVPCVQ